MKHLTTVPFLITALLFSAVPVNATTPRFNGDVISAQFPVFNAVFYGAKCDGTTDDAAHIQSAITAAAAVNGGIVQLPQGGCIIDSTLNITTNNIIIRGYGEDSSHDVGVPNPATSLKWNGTSGGTMISCSAVSGASNQKQVGCGVENLALISNNGLAGIGISIVSSNEGHFTDLYLDQFATHGIYIGVLTTLGEATSSQQNLFQNIVFRNFSNTGDFIYLDGSGSGNASMNTFVNIGGGYYNGNAIDVNNGDNNTFINTQFNRSGGGTGIGVNLVGANAYGNVFLRLTPGAGGVTKGTGSLQNVVWDYDNSNGSPAPTGSGQLFYTDHTGRLFSPEGVHIGMGANSSEADNARSRMGANEALRLYNGSNDHLVLDDGTHVIGVNIDSNGYLRITGASVFNMNGAALVGATPTNCSATSGVPCRTSGSCGTGGTASCTMTFTVPSNSFCIAQGNSGDATTVAEWFKTSLSTNTLTVTGNLASAQAGTIAVNVHCL